MNLPPELEEALGEKIIEALPATGGCIAQSYLIKTESSEYFTKFSTIQNGMFPIEARGLKELSLQDKIQIPKVISFTENFLILEKIEVKSPANGFWKKFGKSLAQLHQVASGEFGFYENNFIGSTPQINTKKQNWADFFWENRIRYQLESAQGKNFLSEVDISELENTTMKLLRDYHPSPSLLHGDLWSGNFLCSENNLPVLIDPAVYYGDREADLAMTRLFGGFSPEFYESYNKEFPLHEEWKARLPLYQLYHVLNHINLFGSSYEAQALGLIANLK